MENIFFSNWESILRALVITTMGYITLVIIIRISGKRTLAKMNAFDFIVTVALGSCLASVSLNKEISLAEGVVVYSTLIFLQFIITWTSVRVKRVKKIVSGKPVLLLYKGALLEEVMKQERITIQEIYVAARASGTSSLEDIEVIVLETTGDISVIRKINNNNENEEVLKDVSHYPPV